MYIANSVPYIIFFIGNIFLFLYCSTFFQKKELTKFVNLYSTLFFAFCSILFLGCRGFIAADWLSYYPYFKEVPTLFDGRLKILEFISNSYYEKGYCIYNIFCKTLFNNYLAFQFISFVIDLTILHFIFRYYCQKYYFLCWLFFWMFSGFVLEIITLRNTKAILLFLISIKYLNQRKPLKYYILNIIGFLFHFSSIFYFPLYFVNRIKRHPKIELFLFIVGNVIFLAHISWTKDLLISAMEILPITTIYKNAIIFLCSDHYSSAYGITIGYIERLFSFILVFAFSSRIIKEDNRMLVIYYFFLIFSFLYLYCSDFFILIERVPNLFACSYWILYPKIYEKLSKNQKYCFMAILLIYGMLKTIILLDEKWAYYDNFLFKAYSPMYREQYLTY